MHLVIKKTRTLIDALREAHRGGYQRVEFDGTLYELSDGHPVASLKGKRVSVSYRPLPWAGAPDGWLSCFMAAPRA